MDKVKKFFKQLFCRHNYIKINGSGTHGTWKCGKCGKEQFRELGDYY